MAAAAIVMVSLATAACAGSASPTWTYVPIEAPSMPTATGAPTPTGASTATGAPTSAPSIPPASAGPSAAATVLDITARNIAFSPTDLTATADTPLTIHFDNEDPGVAHDVAIHRGTASGESVFQGDTITGGASTDYQVSSLPAGSYTIICTVHPTQMIATLTVK